MKKEKIIEKKFDTPIGTVVCGLRSNFSKCNSISYKNYQNGQSEIFETTGHQIELIEFKISQPLHNGGMVIDSSGWIWKCKKNNSNDELLETYCLLEQAPGNIEYDAACGENLDAIEASDETWILHIGTEDGETLYSRANDDDDFPSRLAKMIDFDQSIIKMEQNGIYITIPNLQLNELIHFQYLAAYDKKEADNLNGWYAVDENKRKLENWIGIGGSSL